MNETEHATYVDRIVAYMNKALHEAKVNTSWVNPNLDYDQAVEAFVRAILDRTPANEFLADLAEWSRQIAESGMLNSLAQTLLKLTAPGVPDIYQGNEIWDWSLVDPDNRRPVDYNLRATLLTSIEAQDDATGARLAECVRELVAHREDGRIKLYLTRKMLHYRAAHAELFANGDYLPLEAAGTRSEHVCAFARSGTGEAVIVVVPRFLHRLNGGASWAEAPSARARWDDTRLVLAEGSAGERYRNVLTGEEVTAVPDGDRVALPLSELFGTLPLALLERVDEGAEL
jgi:(1->4)-alpha-D-glucan 1-alpha-D-glucosylmutase